MRAISERLGMPVLQVLRMPWPDLVAELTVETAYRAHMSNALPETSGDDIADLIRAFMVTPSLELARYW